MISLNLAMALVNLWREWKVDREWQAWLKLIVSTVYSAVIAFLGTDGICLLAGMHWLTALGSAMLATAVSIVGVVLRVPQGRSLILSLPPNVVAEYQKAEQAGETTIVGKNAV
jgi:hypothetical protein